MLKLTKVKGGNGAASDPVDFMKPVQSRPVVRQAPNQQEKLKMIRLVIAASSLAMAAPAAAQMSAETRTVVTPVAPPATAVSQVAPGTFVVTPVPGVAAATTVKVQRFGDYDLNKDRVYSPMEFAQAIYFLATSDPIAGNPKLPAWDRYTHRGAFQEMPPQDAVGLLNATADEFTAVDMNNNWRVEPAELQAVALM